MNPESEFLSMYPADTLNPSIYDLLLTNLNVRNFDAFKSCMKKALRKHSSADILNHVFPPPEEKTLLEIACSKGFTEFVILLLGYLEHREVLNKINESHRRAPIHFAVERGHIEVLKVLLQDSFINPNLEVETQTALHIAIKNQDIKCVEMLLKAGARPDIPNSLGITALHQAASIKHKEIVQLILTFSKEYEVPLDIDTFKDVNEDTTRNVLQKNFPEIQTHDLPKYQVREIDDNLLEYFLNANDEANFLKNLSNVDPNKSINVHGLIKVAAGHNLSKAVMELISRNENVNLSEAAEIALQKGHYEVVKEMLRYDSDLGKKLIILACQELTTPCSWGLNHQSIRLKFLKLIMEQKNVDVRVEDDKGNTPLHYAAKAENTEAVELLLRAESYIGHLNHFGKPPLAHISPVTLEKYFDECITSNKEHTEDFEIHYDYACLKPYITDRVGGKPLLGPNSMKHKLRKEVTEIQTLLYIAENKTFKHLLKHPLLSSFLYLKWSRIRHILWTNLVFYSVFFITLFAFTIFSNSKSEDEKMESFQATEEILRIITIVQLAILALRELFLFFSSPVHYISNLENWFEVTLIILIGVYLFTNNIQVAAIGILLSAWELVVLIGQLPRVSTEIQIFKTVLISFVLFLLLYAFLIFAFALAFYLIFQGDDKFPNALLSLFKTIVMLQGEFEASTMPFEMNPVLGRIVFLLFTFFIAIVLFNLLVGIAVSDTLEIRDNAELVALIARTNMIARIEGIAVGISSSTANQCCSCCQPALKNLKLNPFASHVKRVLIFPSYLPEGILSEKPYKSHEILIRGKLTKRSLFDPLEMEPSISDRAKEILSRRGNVSDEDNVLSELEEVNKKLEKLEQVLNNLSGMDAIDQKLDKFESILLNVTQHMTHMSLQEPSQASGYREIEDNIKQNNKEEVENNNANDNIENNT